MSAGIAVDKVLHCSLENHKFGLLASEKQDRFINDFTNVHSYYVSEYLGREGLL